MFKQLVEKITSLVGERQEFDPSSLNDPIALKTHWTPAKSGGTNFQTYKLVSVDPNRVEFKATLVAKLFYCIFLFVGLGMITGIIYFRLRLGPFPTIIVPLGLVFGGLVFIGVGAGLFYFTTTPTVFDKRQGFFWKGRKAQTRLYDGQARKDFAELNRIHALQLISEYCAGNNNSYYSYELNIVLDDGSRINVIDHGDAGKLRDDAASLSRFLDKPLWDAI